MTTIEYVLLIFVPIIMAAYMVGLLDTLLDRLVRGPITFVGLVIEIFANPTRVEEATHSPKATGDITLKYINRLRFMSRKLDNSNKNSQKYKVQRHRRTHLLFGTITFAFYFRWIVALLFIIFFGSKQGYLFFKNFGYLIQ